jgi:hypothetical protein
VTIFENERDVALEALDAAGLSVDVQRRAEQAIDAYFSGQLGLRDNSKVNIPGDRRRVLGGP